MDKYQNEVKEKYGKTKAYHEYQQKTKNYTNNQWDNVTNGLNEIIKEFASKMQEGLKYDSVEVLLLVEKLQNYITDNYYTCTKEILLGLGKMYVEDLRFKNNIDKFGNGTALFISSAINKFCS